MTTWNLREVLLLCTQAGRIALNHFDNPTHDYKDDDSVVTQADREIEQFLGRSFDKPQSGSFIVGEETVDKRDDDYLMQAMQATAWVVDPIDGTILYANHLHDWGVSIGYMTEGVLREGVVYFPLSGEIFVSEDGHNYRGTASLSAATPEEQAESIELSRIEPRRRSYSKSGIVAVTQELTRDRRLPFTNPVLAGGSAVYPLVALAEGRIMAYVGSLNLWDFAGSLPLLLNAGAVISLEDGTPVGGAVDDNGYHLGPESTKRFKSRGMIVAALDEEVHGRLREMLDAVAEPA